MLGNIYTLFACFCLCLCIGAKEVGTNSQDEPYSKNHIYFFEKPDVEEQTIVISKQTDAANHHIKIDKKEDSDIISNEFQENRLANCICISAFYHCFSLCVALVLCHCLSMSLFLSLSDSNTCIDVLLQHHSSNV